MQFPTPLERRRAACLALALSLVSFACATGNLVFFDDLQSAPDGVAPVNWTASGQWKVRTYGANSLVVEEDAADSPEGRKLTRVFTPAIVDSWSVDFDYDWRHGAATALLDGRRDLFVAVAMLDASGSGYQARVYQGDGGEPANSTKGVEIYKITNGAAALLGGGRGYNQPGSGDSFPQLKHVRFVRDAITRRLSVYRTLATGQEEVARVADEAAPHTNSTQLVLSAAGFADHEGPAFDNISVTRPGRFAWGVVGHPDFNSSPAYWTAVPLTGSSTTSPIGQVDLVKELGCSHYRVGAGARFAELLAAADAKGVTPLPVVSVPLSDITGTSKSVTDLYNLGWRTAFDFARAYPGRFSHVELGNEFENLCIKGKTYAGDKADDYDLDKYDRAMNALKGLSDGLRAGDPNAKRIINAGWYHYGFIDMLIADEVAFEVLGWHWYSDGGSMGRVMKTLSGYGRPIWITETNRKSGSYLPPATYFSSDFQSEGLSSPPAGWTASGTWRVLQVNTVKAVNNLDADGPRSLTKTFPPLTDSWEVEFYYDWRTGGGSSFGNYTKIIDCDMLNDANEGYRVRVRQGDNGEASKSGSVLGIYKVTDGGATATLIDPAGGQGKGYNQGGYIANGGSPNLKRIRFRRDKIDYRMYVDRDTDTVPLVTGDGAYGAFTKLVFTASGFTKAEQPLLDNISLKRYLRDDNAEADHLSRLVNEMWNFPLVEGLFVYELLDQPSLTAFYDESCYGLCSIVRDGAGQYSFNDRKPAFHRYKAEIARLGTVPPNHGDIVVDDGYLAPATKYSVPATWLEDAAAPGYHSLGYRHDNAAGKGGYVRFYGYIPVAGNYAVSIKFPPQSIHALDVAVRVHYKNNAVATFHLNQQADPGGWLMLGTFGFNAWQPGLPSGSTAWESSADAAYVEISNAGTTHRVVVDAVKFHRVP